MLLGICYFLIFNSTKKTKHDIKIQKGTICLVVDDFGFIFDDFVKDFFQLHNNLTVAIIPGSPFAKQIAEYAHRNNIESIVHMPMESYEKNNQNYPIELNEKLNSLLVEQRVKEAFIENPYALGMNNHQGSKATTSLQLMKDLARTLKSLDKYFLDSFTHPESRAYITMRRYGVATQLRQIFIDHVEDEQHILKNLDSLVNLSHEMDIAVGIGHIKPLTLKILKEKIPLLEQNGYRFIALSQAVR